MNKIPVYFVPGMAANTTIFENISLPAEQFEVVFIPWKLPKSKETIQQYAKRMASEVKHDNAVLIGVSFGGVMVQEMAVFLKLRKLIIISSVKSTSELPRRMKIAKTTKAYKLLPTSWLKDVEKFVKYAFGDNLKRKLKLYEKYLHVRDKNYLDWALENMMCWERAKCDPNVIHIHGDADEVFPVKHIKDYIKVKGGTHAMILSKYKWFNANLPKIITEE
ncbi:MAG: alpha/beta hydrolase [Flavobacteriales bacterium]|nr:alpha/beta hydrolase [Flavobacteriales bacterium]